jgi:hypothetical protein
MAGMEKTGEGQRQYLSLCLKDSLYPDSYEKTMKANLEILKKALQ